MLCKYYSNLSCNLLEITGIKILVRMVKGKKSCQHGLTQIQVRQLIWKKLIMDNFSAKKLQSHLFWGSMCDKLTNISQYTSPSFLKNMKIKLWATIMKQIFAFSIDRNK